MTNMLKEKLRNKDNINGFQIFVNFIQSNFGIIISWGLFLYECKHL